MWIDIAVLVLLFVGMVVSSAVLAFGLVMFATFFSKDPEGDE